MYSNTHLAGVVASGGIIAVTSGWAIAGYVILGTAVVVSGIITTAKLLRSRQ